MYAWRRLLVLSASYGYFTYVLTRGGRPNICSLYVSGHQTEALVALLGNIRNRNREASPNLKSNLAKSARYQSGGGISASREIKGVKLARLSRGDNLGDSRRRLSAAG